MNKGRISIIASRIAAKTYADAVRVAVDHLRNIEKQIDRTVRSLVALHGMKDIISPEDWNQRLASETSYLKSLIRTHLDIENKLRLVNADPENKALWEWF